MSNRERPRAARRLAQLVVLPLLLLAGQAGAAGIDGVSITAGIEGLSEVNVTDAMLQQQIDAGTASLAQDGEGTLTISGLQFSNPGYWDLDVGTLTFNPDPVVSAVGGFTNTSGAAQDFFLTFTVPIIPIANTVMGGSTQLTLGDADVDGAGTLENVGSGAPGYSGQIDDMLGTPTDVLDLLSLFALSPTFPGDTTQSIAEIAGLPGPSISGPAANVSIGLTHRFRLSAGDQVTFNSIFVVEPAAIPEPHAALLLALGFAALLRARSLT